MLSFYHIIQVNICVHKSIAKQMNIVFIADFALMPT